MKYEILEHTADLKIRAFGKDLPEVFLNAMKAMFDCLNVKRKTKNVKQQLKIKSNNSEFLLVDFLSEVLYLSQVHKEAYNNIKFTKFTNTELKAELTGQKVEGFGKEVKAVTYHDLEVKETNGLFEAVVLFDI